MRRRFLAFFAVLTAVCLFAIVFAGCTNKIAQQPGQNNTTQQRGNMMGGNLQGRAPNSGNNTGILPGATPSGNTGAGMNPGGMTGIIPTPGPGVSGKQNMGTPSRLVGFSYQKADNILSQLGKIDGARDINAVVRGNTCIVGYTPDRSSNGVSNKGGNTGDMITSKVKKIDGTINNVVVSNSAAISARIKKLSDDIRANKPTSITETEFNKLLQAIKPSGK